MALQLLGGRARGFVLQAPPEDITRPTAVLLKRRLFDWRQNWDGRNFIDLCAGSGSMGLEALSRGAQYVLLNEANKTAYRVLQKNIDSWQDKQGLLAQETLEVSQLDYLRCLTRLKSHALWESEQTVLFFDPPWEAHEMYAAFWEAVKGFQGEVWIESDNQKGVALSEQRQHLSRVVKEVLHGQHWVLVGRP